MHDVPGRAGRSPAQERQLAAGQPRPARRDDHVGPVRGGELRRLQQVRVGGQRMAALPGPGGRLGQQRPARRGGQPGQRGRVGAVAGHDHAPLGPGQVQDGRGGSGREPGPRRPVRPPVQRLRPGSPVSPVRVAGHQRLAQGQVQVHRAGQAARRPAGQAPGPTGQRAPVPGHARPGLGHADLAEPAHCVPVQLELVDGLVGAGAAQLGRPVGGQHQQRHPGLVGLDDRGVEVRRGRARGAQHRRRAGRWPWPGPGPGTRPTARPPARAAAGLPARSRRTAPWPAGCCASRGPRPPRAGRIAAARRRARGPVPSPG